MVIPNSVTNIESGTFFGCTSLSRIAIPKGIELIEDEEIFSSCDSLTDISFGGSREEWELLTHGKSITVEHSDLTVTTPKITFLDLKK